MIPAVVKFRMSVRRDCVMLSPSLAILSLWGKVKSSRQRPNYVAIGAAVVLPMAFVSVKTG